MIYFCQHDKDVCIVSRSCRVWTGIGSRSQLSPHILLTTANTRHGSDVGLILSQRRSRYTNIKPILDQYNNGVCWDTTLYVCFLCDVVRYMRKVGVTRFYTLWFIVDRNKLKMTKATTSMSGVCSIWHIHHPRGQVTLGAFIVLVSLNP